jgi:hypothetical protein
MRFGLSEIDGKSWIGNERCEDEGCGQNSCRVWSSFKRQFGRRLLSQADPGYSVNSQITSDALLVHVLAIKIGGTR